MGRLYEIFLIDFTWGYVVGKYELARSAVKKVDLGQILCNCEKNQLCGGYPRGGGCTGRCVKFV